MRQRVRAKHLAQNKDFGPGAPAAGGVKCRPSRACLIMHFVRMYLCLQGPIIHCRRMYLDLCGSYGTSHDVYYKTTQDTSIRVYLYLHVSYGTSHHVYCTTTQGHQQTTRGPRPCDMCMHVHKGTPSSITRPSTETQRYPHRTRGPRPWRAAGRHTTGATR